MSEHEDLTSSGVTRRRLLVRGAVAGGVVWAAPSITSVGASAFAQGTPAPGVTDISFIGLNVTCSNGAEVLAVLKFEGCTEENGCFEADPGEFPGCDGFVANPTKADGDALGFEASGPDADGCVTIIVPDDCVVTESVIKGGQECCAGPTGGPGPLLFCPCP